WTPSRSAARMGRVVAETATRRTGNRGTTSEISVPLPAPDGPVTTKTGRCELVPGEEANELRPLPLREAADGLRLADAALVEEARGLHAPALRDRHQDVEHLRGRDVLRRRVEDRLDLDATLLYVLLQLRAPDPDVVGPLERLHPLIARPSRGLGLSLGRRHHRAVESNN